MSVFLDYIVLDVPWKIKVTTNDNFIALHGEDLCGVTEAAKKLITINKRSLNYETICHELTHVYCYYCCFSNCEFTMDDMEELFCEVMAIHGQSIINNAKIIFDKLVELSHNMSNE